VTSAGEKTVRLTRAHLEEDAGKSLHEDFHGMSGIDLNRAGTPLLEIVSEPDMCSSEEAVAYAKALHGLVRWIDVCDGNMQEGSFRCDANVSVRRPGEPLGTRREIKNLNSFRFLQQAIDYEVRWQIETLEDGGRIQQATVLFDPDSGETRSMRSKEDAHDYRYFPDPDLLPLGVGEDWIAAAGNQLAAIGTPAMRKAQYLNEHGLTPYDAALLTQSRETAAYFDAVVSAVGAAHAKTCANWVTGELAGALNRAGLDIGQSPVSAARLAALVLRVIDGTLSSKMAKEVFEAVWNGEGEPDAIIDKRGLKQISDGGAIEKLVDDVLAGNAKQVEDYRAGKDKAFNSLVGQVMKASRGKANPAQVNEILKKKLGG
jgi:aspartyl-tRNA(Asn)/glutamyl-tRNA(Gln) amidotransferase subunit B